MDEMVPAPQELESLTQFLYLAPVGLVQTRGDGEVLMLNPKCAQWLLPLAPDGDLRNLFDALSPLLPDLRQRVNDFKSTSGTICEGLYLPVNQGKPGGAPGQVLSLTLIRLDHDLLMAVLDDVTEQLRRERTLRQSQAWLHSFIKGSSDYACMSLDAEGRVQDWSDSVRRLTGHTPHQIIGKHFSVLLADADMSAKDTLVEADAGGWVIEERNLKHADGTHIWGSALLAAQHQPGESDPDKRGYSLVVRNMDNQKAAIEELKRVVSSDHLTGLANRRAFFESADVEVHRCYRLNQPLSVLMCDADHFKAVNDTYGHDAGDLVLRHIASVLSEHVRQIDTLARFGGEEFIILMPGLGEGAAVQAAEHLCKVLRDKPAQVGDRHVVCTMSIGVASTHNRPEDLDALIKRADRALYAAKAAGRDRVETWEAESARECA